MNLIKKVISFDEIDSTNNFAHQYLSENVNTHDSISGTVIYANFQTSGKGQAGNKWESEKGKNLLLSIIIMPPHLIAEQQFIISKFISVSIILFLRKLKISAKIKWPNDIYIDNKKVGGILIENVISGNYIKSSIIGIGLNINQKNFSKLLPNPISISLLNNKDYEVKDIFTGLTKEIDFQFRKIQNNKYNFFNENYLKYLYRLNKRTLYKIDGTVVEAKITGITEFGQLIVLCNNEERIFNFKEIEFVI